jgi:predicted GH43/DUF377 family glycosyl hydrolase
LVFDRVGQLRTSEGQNLIASGALSDPTILFEDGKYRMWFTAAIKVHTDEQEMGIAYAESNDGLVWTPKVDPETGELVLLVRPTPDSFDAGGVETPAVVKGPNDRYFLFYSADAPPKGSNKWAIGLALSDDGGNTWNKWTEGPVLTGNGEWEGPFSEESDKGAQSIGGVSEPTIIYDAEQQLFKLWYSGLGHRNGKLGFRIGYGTSPDGVNWTRQADPVLEPGADGEWDDAVVSHVNVVHDPKYGYHMFYFGTSGANYAAAERSRAAMIPGAIGHAYSKDGLSWQRDANPVLSTIPDSWEAWMVGGPTSIIQGDQVKLWYFGSAVHNEYKFTLGMATAKLSDPIEQ